MVSQFCKLAVSDMSNPLAMCIVRTRSFSSLWLVKVSAQANYNKPLNACSVGHYGQDD